MITEKMTEQLNKQINAELFAAYLYLSMSANSTAIGLGGAANWFFVQSKEEMTHAQRLYDYVSAVGSRVTLLALEQPQTEWTTLLEMFEATLGHEQKVTAMINALVDLAVEEKDHATQVFLQWFVSEQVEEEENANEILGQLRLAGDGGGLFMVDKELGARVFTMPVDLAQ